MKLLKSVLTQINSLNISKYRRCQSSTNSTIRVTGSVFSQLEHYVDGSSRDLIQRLSTQVEVRTQFISKEEECALFQELEPGLKRKRYQFDHWDDVSLNFYYLRFCQVTVTCFATLNPGACQQM